MIAAIAIFFIFLAGICNGVMDTLQFHYSISIFRSKNPLFWNPKESWRNKYKDGNPDLGPKFPFSTTALVFLTDGWHLFQFFMLACFRTALVLIGSQIWPLHPALWIVIWFLLVPVFSGGFWLMYNKILKA